MGTAFLKFDEIQRAAKTPYWVNIYGMFWSVHSHACAPELCLFIVPTLMPPRVIMDKSESCGCTGHCGPAFLPQQFGALLFYQLCLCFVFLVSLEVLPDFDTSSPSAVCTPPFTILPPLRCPGGNQAWPQQKQDEQVPRVCFKLAVGCHPMLST